jgi:transposase-like protein
MNCPRCGSLNYRKDGFVNSLQRYECKECHYHYTVAKKSDVKSAATRHKALELYLEGLGFRAMGRLLQISYGTVYALG